MGTDAAKVPSVIRAGLTIFAIKLSLKIRGYSRTMQWMRRAVGNVPPMSETDVAIVEAAEHAVAMAGALYPGRALCLEQSLALYYLLRRQGVLVRYCQGVHPCPFQAHAWIEYQGEVVNDVREHAVEFSRLPDQLP